MRTKNLTWYKVEKDEVPSLAFGVAGAKGSGSSFPESLLSKSSPIVFGFSGAVRYAPSYSPPSIILLKGGEVSETLSWIRVYAGEAFPMSQFARVMTGDDYDTFEQFSGVDGFEVRPDKWACVILGEILAQGEADAELSLIPLSRASACFSTAIARTTIAYRSFELTKVCTDRLREIESEARFVKRQVSISDLVSIWAMNGADSTVDNASARSVAELVVDAQFRHVPASAGAWSYSRLTADYPGLLSDSAEERVLAFQKLLAATEGRSDIAHRAASALSVAAAAFLVGRGTSHSFLLRKSKSIPPVSFVWFSLMSALIGPRGWDIEWTKAVKGIERHLRLGFDLDEPPNADICWTEYEWLARTFKGTQCFADLAKLFPKTLSIELLPGATCQFRIVAPETRVATVSSNQVTGELLARENEFRSIVEQFSALAAKAKQVLDVRRQAEGAQRDLVLSNEKPAKSKKPTKKPKYS